MRAGVPSEGAERLKALELENRDLRQPTRSCARRALILPRRSSTAGSSRDRVHRRSPRGARGRADLQAAADRPVDLLRPCGQTARSGQVGGRGCRLKISAIRSQFKRLRRLRRASHFRRKRTTWLVTPCATISGPFQGIQLP